MNFFNKNKYSSTTHTFTPQITQIKKKKKQTFQLNTMFGSSTSATKNSTGPSAGSRNNLNFGI